MSRINNQRRAETLLWLIVIGYFLLVVCTERNRPEPRTEQVVPVPSK